MHSWMRLVKSSNTEVSGVSESRSSKIVSIEINRNTKVQVITKTNQNLVGTNWLYARETRIRLSTYRYYRRITACSLK